MSYAEVAQMEYGDALVLNLNFAAVEQAKARAMRAARDGSP